MKLTINNHNFNVEVRGEGQPILFIHGFPLDHIMWNSQLDYFSKSYKVIAPDLRGFGQTEITEGTVSMEQFADDLNHILDAFEIEEPVILCGLSMGGYISWEFIKNYPDRIHSIILCDTRSAADSEQAIENRMNMVETVLSEGTDSIIEGMIPKLVSKETLQNKTDIVASLTEMIVTTNPEAVAAALRGMAERPDSTEILASVQKPTLVIVGEEDQLTPADEMQDVANQIPNSQFAMIKGAGHMAPMECPEKVNHVIDNFLTP